MSGLYFDDFMRRQQDGNASFQFYQLFYSRQIFLHGEVPGDGLCGRREDFISEKTSDFFAPSIYDSIEIGPQGSCTRVRADFLLIGYSICAFRYISRLLAMAALIDTI